MNRRSKPESVGESLKRAGEKRLRSGFLFLVFNIRRTDGRRTRPFFANIDSEGNQGREFILHKKDPAMYDRMPESFNIPELVSGRITLKPRDLVAAPRKEILLAQPEDQAVPSQMRDEEKIKAAIKENERPIHE